MKSLKRPYQKLLNFREKIYERVSNITIPRDEIGRDYKAEKFLQMIKDRL